MDPVISWLLDGDPAIRWQVQRDLLGQPKRVWQAEQARTATEGWGAALLAHQAADGRWGGGLYSPKWTSSTYTLLALRAIGLPRENPQAQRGAQVLLAGMLGAAVDDGFRRAVADLDRCIVGMLLQVAVYFGINDDRLEAMADNLLAERMPDGAWNCRRLRRPRPTHSSFHTTFNVLEGVRDYLDLRPARGKRRAALLAAEAGALEFMLQHRLYQSHRTGRAANPKFTLLSYPPRWHYDVLRGLVYFAQVQAPRDPRLQTAIDLLLSHRRAGGGWPVQQKYAGRVYFDMEKTGGLSRWNTLRALRVLRWWEAES